jgi:hypothetical protein
MIHRPLLVGLFALGAILPEATLAQSDQIRRNPDGTVVDPVLRYPDGTPVPATAPLPLQGFTLNIAPREVDVTGTVLPALPVPQRDVSGTTDRPGCEVQSYVVGPNRRVRVHRC